MLLLFFKSKLYFADNEKSEEKKAGRFVCTSVSEPSAAWARMEEGPGSFKAWREMAFKKDETDETVVPPVTVAGEDKPTTTIGFQVVKDK